MKKKNATSRIKRKETRQVIALRIALRLMNNQTQTKVQQIQVLTQTHLTILRQIVMQKGSQRNQIQKNQGAKNRPEKKKKISLQTFTNVKAESVEKNQAESHRFENTVIRRIRNELLLYNLVSYDSLLILLH